MNLKDFDIDEFMHEVYPFTKKNVDSAESTRKSLKKLLSLFAKDSKHVFRFFPLEEYDKDSIKLFLKRVVSNKEMNREAVSLVNKISVDRDMRIWIIEDNEVKSQTESILEILPEYEPLQISNARSTVRYFIRSNSNNVEQVLKNLLELNRECFNEILVEQKIFYMMGLDMKNFDYLTEYMQYIVDGILQVINYCIITNKEFKAKRKMHMLSIINNKLLELDKLMNLQLDKKKIERRENIISRAVDYLPIEEATEIFVDYLTKRSEYIEEALIFNKLKQEELDEPTLFTEVLPKYIALKEPCDISEIKNIITEDKSISDYNCKLEEVIKIIDIFKRYGGRDIDSNNAQDIKVHLT